MADVPPAGQTLHPHRSRPLLPPPRRGFLPLGISIGHTRHRTDWNRRGNRRPLATQRFRRCSPRTRPRSDSTAFRHDHHARFPHSSGYCRQQSDTNRQPDDRPIERKQKRGNKRRLSYKPNVTPELCLTLAQMMMNTTSEWQKLDPNLNSLQHLQCQFALRPCDSI